MTRIQRMLDEAYINMTGRLDKQLEREETRKCGGKEVIMEFALGAVAIVLAILFRDQLKSVLTTIGTTFNQKIQAMFTSL